MFRTWFLPSSGALDCVYGLWYNAPTILPVGSLEAELSADTRNLKKFSCVMRAHNIYTSQALKTDTI